MVYIPCLKHFHSLILGCRPYFRAFFIVLWGTKNGGRGVFLRFASQKNDGHHAGRAGCEPIGPASGPLASPRAASLDLRALSLTSMPV